MNNKILLITTVVILIIAVGMVITLLGSTSHSENDESSIGENISIITSHTSSASTSAQKENSINTSTVIDESLDIVSFPVTDDLTDGVNSSVDDTSLSLHVHNYARKTIAATCTENGYTLNKCACGATYMSSIVAAKGHTFVDMIVQPNCNTMGYTLHKCPCGYGYSDTFVPSKEHQYIVSTIYPTVTENGYTEHKCKNCGICYREEYTDILPINVNNTPFLTNLAVRRFMALTSYNRNDYSYTEVRKYLLNDDTRKDIPLPVLIKWISSGNVKHYEVSISSVYGKISLYTTETKIEIYNLIPNTSYSYIVYAVQNDGTKTIVVKNTFTTGNTQTRLLYVEGIQNVRDIGGYQTLDGKVQYGKIIRGSAMDEDASNELSITENGINELLTTIGVGSVLDLRGNINTTVLENVRFKAVPYKAYTEAITNKEQRENFKIMFEYIVDCLKKDQTIYIHCSGGCDRTGTLTFLLLGLLGVNENDLAKEYELSAFSQIGRARSRNSTEYDYKGLVGAMNEYKGSTLQERIYSFAKDCGISEKTISEFEDLMLK